MRAHYSVRSVSFLHGCLTAAIFSLILIACSAFGKDASTMTTPEENKEIVRRAVEEGVNAGDLDVFREMLASDYTRHSQSTTAMPEIRGIDQMLVFLEESFTAFPDWHEEIILMIAEDDKVAYITVGTATHTGPLGDIPPTGKSVEVVNHIVQRIEERAQRKGLAERLALP